ncbi:GntR family transcriptional regulator [Candidatus Enterococcus murrayae]|uniref:GntR family transcriptional regulator n=1 Tax=Candidatus Enterococcus murrayae TaxID=2815321 RepID=A0ABS3HNB8_9ENTE|nr:GntR family transcriptional regulator [Enterococcus sp. MJM16]MBO0454933.1 GntR family transcriptional regulator [Enterococcus sp. MJM16]
MINVEKFEVSKREHPFFSITDLVYLFLQEEIIHLHLRPNEKLNESRIANELKISRTPVRKALDKLLEEFLVEKKGKLYTVASMSKSESLLLCEARIAIEGYAVFLATSKITPEQIKRLEELTVEYEQVDLEDGSWQYAECDHAFHNIVIEAAENPHISRMYETMELRLRHYRHCLIGEIGRKQLRPILDKSARNHRAILNAIKLGFADQAKALIEKDIRGMYEVFFEWR